MNLPNIADHLKRSIIAETATRLAATHGRRKMFSAAEVGTAMHAANFPSGWTGWGVAVFCTDAEFREFCAAEGLSADYNTTRADALRFLDKPQPKVPAAAITAAAAAAALTTGAAFSQADSKKEENSGDGLADVADIGVDVVGGIFDMLDIFS